MPEKDWFTLDKVGECVSVCVCAHTCKRGGLIYYWQKCKIFAYLWKTLKYLVHEFVVFSYIQLLSKLTLGCIFVRVFKK